MKTGLARANHVLLEPYTKVEIETPEQYLGDIIANINSRRGTVVSMKVRSDLQIIEAHVPLAEIFNYSTHLRSLSQGRASFTMEVLHYIEVPQAWPKKFLKNTSKKTAEFAKYFQTT
jgi:elongation factor G